MKISFAGTIFSVILMANVISGAIIKRTDQDELDPYSKIHEHCGAILDKQKCDDDPKCVFYFNEIRT